MSPWSLRARFDRSGHDSDLSFSQKSERASGVWQFAVSVPNAFRGFGVIKDCSLAK